MRSRSGLKLGTKGVALFTLLLLASLGCVSTDARNDADAAPSDGSPPSVKALVRAMSNFLASQSSFSFHTENTFEIFDKGQKLQFAGASDVQVRRPNKLFVDYWDDFTAKRVWYDGSQLTLLDVPRRVYATMDAPRELDEALDHFEDAYDLTMPLTNLLGEDPYSLIASAARRASYAGIHDVDGLACHHLAFVGDEIDFQLWIRAETRPEPCKLVIDYKEEPGRPQYVSVMMDWEFGQKIRDSVFVPTLPEEARRIEFLAVGEARR